MIKLMNVSVGETIEVSSGRLSSARVRVFQVPKLLYTLVEANRHEHKQSTCSSGLSLAK